MAKTVTEPWGTNKQEDPYDRHRPTQFVTVSRWRGRNSQTIHLPKVDRGTRAKTRWKKAPVGDTLKGSIQSSTVWLVPLRILLFYLSWASSAYPYPRRASGEFNLKAKFIHLICRPKWFMTVQAGILIGAKKERERKTTHWLQSCSPSEWMKRRIRRTIKHAWNFSGIHLSRMRICAKLD